MQIAQRTFDWVSQKQFARVSCDFNPIHLDAIAARRTHAGAPIVHGIHSLLWVLDCLAKSDRHGRTVRSINARFLQPIYVGDEIKAEIGNSIHSTLRASVLSGRVEVATVAIGSVAAESSPMPPLPSEAIVMTAPSLPTEIRLKEMSGISGRLRFGPHFPELSATFPSAVEAFGLQRMAALACTSCLVGMVVPGLHSMFLGLEASITDDESTPADMLEFSVISVSERVRSVRIGFKARGIQGTLEAINRLPPVAQRDLKSLLSLVSPEEFANSSSLIIGGSRGLGELTAKLIAAGGGPVVVTYAVGRSEADAVLSEINAHGPLCRAIAYDVRQSAATQLASLNSAPTHVYYFATPRIYRRKSDLFDPERFAEFNLFYLNGFYDLVQECRRLNPSGLRVFCPSTAFIDTRPQNMTEYAMSKAAVEVLCSDLTRYLPGVRVLARRLPRLPTDQTSSVMQLYNSDPVAMLLPIIREMHQCDLPNDRRAPLPG